MNQFSRPLYYFALSFLLFCGPGLRPASADPATAFPQPDPSGEEQMLLELMNRARANPALEGVMLATASNQDILNNYLFFQVNTAALVNDFASYEARPPLALNARLMASARAHSLDMAVSGLQQHNGTDGSTFDGRITATGYQWSAAGENIYAWVDDPFFCHVGFNADWGVPSLDHRANIMGFTSGLPQFREVGLSYVPTAVPNFGPKVVTEDFATPADAGVAYVVGVVYADNNHNAAYDQGEGLAGVTVLPSGGTFYALTASAGGFVIPLPTSGSGVLTLTASGGALGAPRVKTIAWTAGTNVKVDFTTSDVESDPVDPTAVPTVSLSVPANHVRSNTGLTGLITVSRVGSDTSAPLLVPLLYRGTAVAGVDYAALPARVRIPAGVESVDLPVQALGGSDERRQLLVRIAHRPRYAVGNGYAWSKVNILIPQG